MKSKIENYLQMDLNPVAIIWSNDKPEKALQLKEGKWACAMHLVAQAAKGKTAVLDRGTSCVLFAPVLLIPCIPPPPQPPLRYHRSLEIVPQSFCHLYHLRIQF